MLVSIIIPVFNGEKNIKKCIDNIIKQTYKNIEIIVLNDGSKDNTLKILEEYKGVDERIKIINKENTGVSDTRNVGINESKGDYIMFLDSDDSIDNNAIKELMQQIKRDNNDMILFGFKTFGSDNRKNDTTALSCLKNKEETLESIISTRDNIYGYIWRAIYSKKLLIDNNILFPNGIKISEDYMFLINTIFHSNNIGINPKEYYNYILGETSMSTKYIPTLHDDMNFVNKWIYENIISSIPHLENGYKTIVCNTYLRFVQNTMRNPELGFKDKIKCVKKVKKEYNYSYYINECYKRKKMFSKKTHMSLVLFKFNLEVLYMMLFRIKQIKK